MVHKRCAHAYHRCECSRGSMPRGLQADLGGYQRAWAGGDGVDRARIPQTLKQLMLQWMAWPRPHFDAAACKAYDAADGLAGQEDSHVIIKGLEKQAASPSGAQWDMRVWRGRSSATDALAILLNAGLPAREMETTSFDPSQRASMHALTKTAAQPTSDVSIPLTLLERTPGSVMVRRSGKWYLG
jgi:hypothetical protein